MTRMCIVHHTITLTLLKYFSLNLTAILKLGTRIDVNGFLLQDYRLDWFWLEIGKTLISMFQSFHWYKDWFWDQRRIFISYYLNVRSAIIPQYCRQQTSELNTFRWSQWCTSHQRQYKMSVATTANDKGKCQSALLYNTLSSRVPVQ